MAANVLGVFRGSGKPDEVKAHETWLGKPMSHVVDFVGRAAEGAANPWAKIDDPSWWANRWRDTPWQLSMSTAILPTSVFTLAEGAKGTYNSHWDKFGRVMVAKGCGDAILRLGWEFNGKFYPWAAGGKEAAYAGYWRQIVTTLRKVPGQAFRFDWCPLAGVGGADLVKAWPGGTYVDFVGLDAYDTSHISASTPDKRWTHQLTRVAGLNWHAKFAAEQAKPMSFPEWGVTTRPNDNLGGGDNAYYITQMWKWIKSHNFAYASYFEDNAPDGDHRLMTTQFPKASAEYRRVVKL